MKLDILNKIKNMSMRTKRIIALVVCVSLLAVAIIQNVKTNKGEAGNKTGGDNVNVSVGNPNDKDGSNDATNGNDASDVGKGVIKVNDTEEYFATIRLNRLNSRSETEESCNEIIDSETASESNVADAVAQMETLKKTTKMETDLETAVKSRGYDDVFVIIENDSVYITVQADSLDGSEASAIATSACEITGYTLDDVVLKGVY
ncbi:MAG: SpoIIIAH-like family protein [Clostridia bacterium]